MLTECLQGDIVGNVDKTSTQNMVERRANILVDTLYLETVIKESGKKKSYLADKLGISVQSLRLKITNVNDFKNSETDILCKELGITSLKTKEKIFFKM